MIKSENQISELINILNICSSTRINLIIYVTTLYNK